MADIIPEELIPEILSRLPVKSLLRFRCVSKHWRALIDSPGFVKSHLNQSTIARSLMDIVFCNGPFYHSIKFNSLADASAHPVVEELTYPYPVNPTNTAFSFTRLLGSINGLLCIHDNNRGIILWNPSTRTHRRHVPHMTMDHLLIRFAFWYWGFGYDGDNDDYKVVRIAVVPTEDSELMETFAWMYSLKFGEWKRICDLPYYLVSGQQRGVFVSNAVHWIVHHPSLEPDAPNLIGAIDMGNEEFHLVTQPEYENNNVFVNLEVLDGCLCLCCSYETSGAFDLWIMKEYRMKESWTRLIKLDYGSRLLMPLAFSENGKKLLLVENFNVLVWYDFERRSFKGKLHNLPQNLGFPYVYIPSLLQPKYNGSIRNSWYAKIQQGEYPDKW